MADNFKPMYWSKKIETDLKTDLVMCTWCDYSYQGEIKHGNRVKIVGAVKPTIVDYTKGTPLTPENLGDNSQYLDIDRAKAFCYGLDDVDVAQSMPEFMNAELQQAKEALAEEAETYLGTLATKSHVSMRSASTEITKANALETIDDILIKLYKNKVTAKTPLAADLCPKHIVKAKEAMNSLFTDNVDYVKNGAVGKYGNVYLRLATCLYNDGTDDWEMIRTKRAIAFANAIDKVTKSDNTYGFGVIVKGLHVYGAKVIRPKELGVILAH